MEAFVVNCVNAESRKEGEPALEMPRPLRVASVEETVLSHLLVFAAEEARHSDKVIDLTALVTATMKHQ